MNRNKNVEVLFFAPRFQEKLWGGARLSDYGYALPSSNVGECWAISALPGMESRVESGALRGRMLRDLWENDRDLFGPYPQKEFPLLLKMIDAAADLSVQVHPDDAYAQSHGATFGKTECWLVLDCPKDASLVYGTTAQTKEELDELVKEGRWNQLLRRQPVNKGDFIFVPAGTVHALTAGLFVLEIQQSSDTTFRLYDYDRRDAAGNLRPLHVAQALAVTKVPFQEPAQPRERKSLPGLEETLFLRHPFEVRQWVIEAPHVFTKAPHFLLLSVLEGKGQLQTEGENCLIEKGKHLCLTTAVQHFTLRGNLVVVASRLPIGLD